MAVGVEEAILCKKSIKIGFKVWIIVLLFYIEKSVVALVQSWSLLGFLYEILPFRFNSLFLDYDPFEIAQRVKLLLPPGLPGSNLLGCSNHPIRKKKEMLIFK